MFLTKECDYGIRVIRALSDGYKKTVETIAEEEQVPKKFAYKIIKKLEKGGLVRSIRGRSGGYILDVELDSLTLYDIVIALDANRYLNECLSDDNECPFRDHPTRPCSVHVELKLTQDMLMEALKAKTMDKILGKEEKNV